MSWLRSVGVTSLLRTRHLKPFENKSNIGMTAENTEPVVCTIDRDSEKAEERRTQLKNELIPKYIAAEETGNGYRVRFEGSDAVMGVARFVNEELKCCSFAGYEIEVTPPYEETHLNITGPEGTKEIFEELVDTLEKNSS